MLLLYTTVVALMSAAYFLVRQRVNALERRYSTAAAEALRLAQQSQQREGNSTRLDPFQSAKRTLVLGQIVMRRDRLELKHDFWQRTAARLTRWSDVIRAWKGRKLPYTFGVLDVSSMLYLVDHHGLRDQLSIAQLTQLVTSLFGG